MCEGPKIDGKSERTVKRKNATDLTNRRVVFPCLALTLFHDYYPSITRLNHGRQRHFQYPFQREFSFIPEERDRHMTIFQNPFKGRRPGNAATTTPPGSMPPANQPQQQQQPDPKSDRLQDATGLQQIQSGNVRLITYSPEQLLQQVEHRRSTVSFGLTGTAWFMDNYN